MKFLKNKNIISLINNNIEIYIDLNKNIFSFKKDDNILENIYLIDGSKYFKELMIKNNSEFLECIKNTDLKIYYLYIKLFNFYKINFSIDDDRNYQNLCYIFRNSKMYEKTISFIAKDCESFLKLPKNYMPFFKYEKLSIKFLNYCKKNDLLNNINIFNNNLNESLNLEKNIFNSILEYIISMDIDNDIKNNLIIEVIINFQITFYQLFIKNHKYKYKSLINYIYRIHKTEYISIKDIVIYLQDYVIMNDNLKLSKFDKYPNYLLSKHNILSLRSEKINQKYDEIKYKSLINLTYEFNIEKIINKENMSENEFNKLEENFNNIHYSEKYFIMYPKTTEEIIEEGKNLNHCVSSYINNILKGNTVIVFLRSILEPEKSLCTIEIDNKSRKIKQAKCKFNSKPSESMTEFIKYYSCIKNFN